MQNAELLLDPFGPGGFSEKTSNFKYPPLAVCLHPNADLVGILNVHGLLSVHRLDGVLVWWRQLDSSHMFFKDDQPHDTNIRLYWSLDGQFTF